MIIRSKDEPRIYYMEYVSDEQKNIVLSDAKYKHINGCAGSRKTDTLIKCAIHFVEKHNQPVLFLTRVSSVTEEINNRLKDNFSVIMKRILGRGSYKTNNYIGTINDTYIGVSNFDAWIDNMMNNRNIPGDDFTAKKIQVFNEIREATEVKCTMKNQSHVSLLIIDEVQDLQPSDMLVILELAKKDKNLHIIIAGDILQSIFGGNTIEERSYPNPMNLFGSIKPKYFMLTKCFRCPKAHINFNNFLMKDSQKKYSLPIILDNNDNETDRPILFAHLPMSKNTHVFKNAEMICSMIRTLMKNDTSIVPGDIAIIMAKTNDSSFYETLQYQLKQVYTDMGKGEAVHHFKTNADGYSCSIDWKVAEGKTVLMSIHADKGKDHKVVFFLGFTERSIPLVHQVFTPEELQAESLANVATTRSTKYLFIGFTFQAPSRYLYRIRLDINPLVYTSWDMDSNAPDIYKETIEAANLIYQVNNPWPDSDEQYQGEELKVSKKSKLQVKSDISKDIERPNDFVKHDWKTFDEVSFGSSCEIDTPLTEDHYPLLGQMCELLVIRNLNKTELINYLRAFTEKRVSFSKNDKLMSIVYDYEFNKRMDNDLVNRCKQEHNDFFSKNPNIRNEFNDLCQKGFPILHKTFDTDNFRRDVKAFLSNKKNHEIKTSKHWNITLLYDQINTSIYRPGIKVHVDYFNEEIPMIHDNIYNYCKTLSNNCLYNMKLGLKGRIQDKNKLKELGFNTNKITAHDFGISGILDLFDKNNNAIHEIKASKLSHPSKEWIIQTGMYAALMDITPSITKYITEYNEVKKDVTWYSVSSINIVNILRGKMYIWKSLPKIDILDILSSPLQSIYNFHDYEIDTLENRILQIREWKKDIKSSKYEELYGDDSYIDTSF
jgi:hypothetical protein